MERIRVVRRKATSRRPAREVEQTFPVPAAETAVTCEDVTALLATIDATLTES